MTDPLRIEPHPESERTYHEQREAFRAQNLQRIRSLLADYRVGKVSMKMMGRPLAVDGATTPELRAKALLAALDAPVTQDFGLDDIPLDLRRELASLAAECEQFEKVTWADGSGTVDHDGPRAACPVQYMTEQEQLDYVDRAIEESKRDR